MTETRSQIVHRPLPADDPRRRKPDIGRAQYLLGWRPRTTLDAGLEQTVAWFVEDCTQERAVRAHGLEKAAVI